MDQLTGKAQKQQLKLAEAAQAAQAKAIAKQEADVSLVEAAQKKLATGGGGGLLAYVDRSLATQLGGAAA